MDEKLENPENPTWTWTEHAYRQSSAQGRTRDPGAVKLQHYPLYHPTKYPFFLFFASLSSKIFLESFCFALRFTAFHLHIHNSLNMTAKMPDVVNQLWLISFVNWEFFLYTTWFLSRPSVQAWSLTIFPSFLWLLENIVREQQTSVQGLLWTDWTQLLKDILKTDQ